MENESQLKPVEIPADALSPDALQGIIDSFIYREGTDYGAQEATHEKKIQDIYKQLDADQIKIVFDPATESVTLMTLHQWGKMKKGAST